MKTKNLLIAMVLVALAPLAAMGASLPSTLVSFQGGIGVIPSTDGIMSDTNIVRGVSPGTLPWVIRALDAKVQTNGHVTVHGLGLLFAGADPIGTTGGVNNVVAELFCGAPNHTAQVFKSMAAPLDTNGDFAISGSLSPLPPTICANPVLLVGDVFGTSFRWFAAGIPANQ